METAAIMTVENAEPNIGHQDLKLRLGYLVILNTNLILAKNLQEYFKNKG